MNSAWIIAIDDSGIFHIDRGNVPGANRERASAYVAANRVGCRDLSQSVL